MTVEMSTEVDKLFTALSKVQATIKDAKLDAVNPHFCSKYATLASVYEAVRSACSAQGLCVTQLASTVDGCASVTTMMGHTSGQWMRSTLIVPLDKATAQGLGSALTYARRYSLAAIVGVASDEDDDGNAAEASAPQQRQAPAPRPAAPRSSAPPPAPALAGNPADFVFPSGSHKGKRVADLSQSELVRWLDYFQSSGNQPKGWVVDGMKAVSAYLMQVVQGESAEANSPAAKDTVQQNLDDIPF